LCQADKPLVPKQFLIAGPGRVGLGGREDVTLVVGHPRGQRADCRQVLDAGKEALWRHLANDSAGGVLFRQVGRVAAQQCLGMFE
jgi:hypothetical protein